VSINFEICDLCPALHNVLLAAYTYTISNYQQALFSTDIPE